MNYRLHFDGWLGLRYRLLVWSARIEYFAMVMKNRDQDTLWDWHTHWEMKSRHMLTEYPRILFWKRYTVTIHWLQCPPVILSAILIYCKILLMPPSLFPINRESYFDPLCQWDSSFPSDVIPTQIQMFQRSVFGHSRPESYSRLHSKTVVWEHQFLQALSNHYRFRYVRGRRIPQIVAWNIFQIWKTIVSFVLELWS